MVGAATIPIWIYGSTNIITANYALRIFPDNNRENSTPDYSFPLWFMRKNTYLCLRNNKCLTSRKTL